MQNMTNALLLSEVCFSSLMSRFPGLLVIYFVNDFQVVPVARISAGMTFILKSHVRF